MEETYDIIIILTVTFVAKDFTFVFLVFLVFLGLLKFTGN